MGELRAVRKWYTDKATEGEMLLDGVHECWTLEDRSRRLHADMPLAQLVATKVYGETAIPTGRYALELYDSPKHGPDTLQLVGVPGFTNSQIHAANKAEELNGCIAVGNDRTAPDDDWIGQSQAALKALRAKVIPRMKAGEPFWITVEEERTA
jgi:hypothetical protein